MAAISNPMSGALLSLAAPDYQLQQMKAQRAYALAQALNEQGMAPIDGHGGSISWTQGLAKIADALVAGSANRRGDKMTLAANQALAQGLRGMFGAGQTPGGPATAAPSAQAPAAMPPQSTPPQSPMQPGPPPAPGLGNDPNPVSNGADPLAAMPPGQPAPPQAAPQQPSAPSPAPMGGSPQKGPWSLTGNPQQDFALYMSNPDEYSKAMIANAAKGGAPTDTEVLLSHARQLAKQGDYQGAAALAAQAKKAGYIDPSQGRPGGWTIYPDGHKEFNPQAPAPGAMPVIGADGKPTGAWTEDPSAAGIQAHQAGAIAGAQASGKAPYEFQSTFENGQPGVRSVASLAGQGGSLNAHYGAGAQGQAGAGGFIPTGPSLGQQGAFEQYGKHSADAFAETQGIANSSPQRVQSLREMQQLISGPGALNTGPTAAKVQQLAEEHGLTFMANDNAFVFNKDAARFVAQSAMDLGLNGSDARLGMMANASPNMKMTPQALKTVVPTMIGLEYAKMAKATAAANWAQHDPGGNAKFESAWRQNYDPRMFSAFAQGGPQALAQAPANLRQQWLKEYRALKGMGVDFTQFAQ